MDGVVRCLTYINIFIDSFPQVFNETSTFQGVIKRLARTAIGIHYQSALNPTLPKNRTADNQAEVYKEVTERIAALIDGCGFHIGAHDKNVSLSTLNFPQVYEPLDLSCS